jgi:acetylornithine deacetylase/succinyl-diaminopimelate desuccinylase family protein
MIDSRLLDWVRHAARERTPALAQALVRIPSPSGDEEAVATFLAKHLAAAGLDTSVPEVAPSRFNVLARLPGTGTGPSLVLQGHLDTVPSYDMADPFGGRVVDGRLHGRGACDMKGGVAAMATAVALAREAGLTPGGDVTLALTVDEEQEKRGIHHLIGGGMRADWGICGEPTDLRMAIAQRGCLAIRIDTHGRSCHGSTPEQGINAIGHMAPILAALGRLAPHERRVPGAETVRSSLSVGLIRGGVMFHVVPSECSVWLDRRTVPGEDAEGVLEELRRLVGEVAREVPDLRAEVVVDRPDWQWPPIVARGTGPFMISVDEPIVETLARSIRTATGREAPCFVMNAWTEADFLVNDAHTPTVVCGPGSLALAHSATESVGVEELVDATLVYFLAIAETRGEAARSRTRNGGST